MFNKLFAALLIIPLLAACTSQYLIRGQGGTSCATVVEQVRSQEQYRGYYGAWLLGYLTHYNYQHERKLGKGYDNNTLLDTALHYCGQNPLADFSDAAQAVVKELQKRT